MTRQTSKEAYDKIREGNLLSKMRQETYEILFRFGPMTASELLKKGREYFGVKSLRDNYQKRLGELRDMGVAYEVKTRVCSVTGMNVIEWDVTDKLPRPLPKKNVPDIIFACPLCWNWFREDSTHTDDVGQLCMGILKKYKACK